MRKIFKLTAMLSSAIVIGSGEVSAEPIYSLLDLGALVSQSGATAINSLGQVAGWSDGHAFVTDSAHQMIDLGTIRVSGLNAIGSTTGSAVFSNGTRAFIGAPGKPLLSLATLGQSSAGNAINAFNQVAGTFDYPSGYRGFYTDKDNRMIDLGTLGGQRSEALGINDKGEVVGWAETPSSRHAFKTDSSGHMSDLGTLGGDLNVSVGHAINNFGIVTGESQIADGSFHAFVTDLSGHLKDLGTLAVGGNPSSAGTAINGLGQVTGYSRSALTGITRWFVTEDGVMTDLNTLILPIYANEWSINFVAGINDAGQIAATAYNRLRQDRAVLLYTTPVPEPSAAVMFGLGAVVLGWRFRRNVRTLPELAC